MALLLSRDTKVFIAPLAANGTEIGKWEVPVLDGFSFSQATNSSEVTIAEMEGASGASRRGKKVFNDSLAPVEWAFSTYVRPFISNGVKTIGASGEHHALEEVMWALFVGKARPSTDITGIIQAADLVAGTPTNFDVTVEQATAAGIDPNATFDVNTATDGNGAGAILRFKFTVDNTPDTGDGLLALDTTVIAQGGSNYEPGDKLFVSKEALQIATGLDATVITADWEVTLPSVSGSTVAGDFGSSEGFARTSTELTIDFSQSNYSTLGTANIYFMMGDITAYKLHACAVNEASIDFDIDGVASINWSGMGSSLEEVSTTGITADYNSATAINTTNNFIRNRLTQLSLNSNSLTKFPGASSDGVYNVTLTGGNITFSNNISYTTPEELGKVNFPLGHVTGTRSVTGNFTCYVEGAGAAGSSGDLWNDMVTNSDVVTHAWTADFAIGGASGTPRLNVIMPKCHIEIPTHSVDDVISIDTSFSALPSDLGTTDEATIVYTGVAL